MLSALVKVFFKSRNDRVLRQLYKKVTVINELEKKFNSLTDAELSAKTDEFKQRLHKGETLEDILPESFATVREVSRRTLGLRHFDVQLIGGMVLHAGNISEMLTGEGKTLGATLPAYLNALTGKGVHIITVNDYLAKRDAAWMLPIYQFLGLTVGVNLTQMSHADKKAAYAADITYGTNNEFGFDYLRDNMAFSLQDRVQRGLYYAIVDEVDSILIDEARTPLIISGPAEDSSSLYIQINQLVPLLKKQATETGEEGDYYLDEKSKQAYLTEQGHQTIEKMLIEKELLQPGDSLYHSNNISLMHHVYSAIRAHALFARDVDYIVKDNQVIIVDEHTGRLMHGRRWSDGLHQAVEAKEGARIQNENQTLASITFQNYFRGYDKLAGMTGTADTEAFEFQQIYGLEVIVIPPNQPVQRKDQPDKVYLTANEKFKAIITEIKDCCQRGQPVLVGTTSIETSEYLSQLLRKENIKHEVLNAKQHEREAHIIAQAGKPGAVTIATNMAGRGTDIVLGGNLEAEIAGLENPTEEDKLRCKEQWQQRHQQVINAGGLHVLGTERHESRRIDNQLRGRSGRQGDPGSSRFYLSLQDNLLRIFASERLSAIMTRIGVPEGEALESSMLSRVIENAQRKVEGHNFDIRKQLLDYDNVANEQRKVVYTQRTDIMGESDVSRTIQAMVEQVADKIAIDDVPPQSFAEQWNIEGLEGLLKNTFNLSLPISAWIENEKNITDDVIRKRIYDHFMETYQTKQQEIPAEILRQVEKSILLQSLDVHWKEHLAAMDHLRQGIHLRGYAQKNPKQEYKREAFEMFYSMLDSLKRDVVSTLFNLRIEINTEAQRLEEERRKQAAMPMVFRHDDSLALNPLTQSENELQEAEATTSKPIETFVRNQPKVGRNEPCPCNSGKKYKHCHGQLQSQ